MTFLGKFKKAIIADFKLIFITCIWAVSLLGLGYSQNETFLISMVIAGILSFIFRHER
jgi:hypothetical protein